MGISVDHIPCLQAWQESIGGISYPLCSDFWPHGAVADKFGVLRAEGISERAIFIIDSEGIIQYIDIHDIDNQPDNEEIFAVLRQLNPEAVEEEPDYEIPDAKVVLFCTSWCPDCRRARQWLDKNEIDYVEVDVDKNVEGAKRVREWANGNLTTPTLNISGNIIVDYDENAYQEAFQK